MMETKHHHLNLQWEEDFKWGMTEIEKSLFFEES